MYKRITILLFLLLPVFTQAQNLVPNGNFEQYNPCPVNYSTARVYMANGWHCYCETADYYNTCGNAPACTFGYQMPLNGNGFVGLVNYTGPSGNFKEHIMRQISALETGAVYEMSMSVNLANMSEYASNNIGVFMYCNGVDTIPGIINFSPRTPQISYTNHAPVLDTQGWVKLADTMIADSAYTHIAIGPFLHDSLVTQIPTSIPHQFFPYAYYYIDSVVLRKISQIMFTPDTFLCMGDSIHLPFTVFNSNYFNTGNVFTLLLSDTSGSFATPTVLGTLSSQTAGVIHGFIPYTLPVGTKYRLRITSSNNLDTLSNNGRNITLSMYPLPVASGNSPLCAKDSLWLKVGSLTPVDIFVWNGPNVSNKIAYSIYKSPVQLNDSGNYVVTATYRGCIANDTIHVHVKQLPAKPFITSNSPICEDDSLQLKATSSTATSFSWSGPGSFISSSADTGINKVTSVASGKYIVSALLDGCKDTTSVSINIKTRPRPHIITPAGICVGDTLILDVNETVSGEQYNWAGPNSFSTNTKLLIQPFANQAMQGKYVVTVQANGCMNSDTAQIIIKPSPDKPIANKDTVLCEGETLHLNANSITTNASYSWIGPANFTSQQISTFINYITLKASGLYIITANLDGCIQRDTIDVLVKPLPEKPIINANSPLQTGQDLYLKLDNPQANVKYRWTGPNGFTSVVPNPIIYKPDTNSVGTYFMIAELNGCYNSNQVLVQIDQRADTGNIFLYPNPNNGDFYIKGVFKTDQQMPVHIYDGIGKQVYTNVFKTNNKKLFEPISLRDYLASGEYSFHIITDGKKRIIRFTVIR